MCGGSYPNIVLFLLVPNCWRIAVIAVFNQAWHEMTAAIVPTLFASVPCSAWCADTALTIIRNLLCHQHGFFLHVTSRCLAFMDTSRLSHAVFVGRQTGKYILVMVSPSTNGQQFGSLLCCWACSFPPTYKVRPNKT